METEPGAPLWEGVFSQLGPTPTPDTQFCTNRLGKFLKTKTDVEISTQPDFEEQTMDFSDVEELMGSINSVPGAPAAHARFLVLSSPITGAVCFCIFVPRTLDMRPSSPVLPFFLSIPMFKGTCSLATEYPML